MKKIVVYTVLVFILVTILFTVWFILAFGPSEHIGLATLRNIVVDRSLFMSIPCSAAYFGIHTAIVKVKNKWILALLILMILALLYAILAYYFLFRVIIISLLQNPFVD